MTSTSTLVGVGTGPLSGRRFDLPNGILTVGRAHTCLLHLDVPGVGDRHARLAVDSDGVHVEDLGSGRPTLVNGRPVVGTRELRGGDVLRIADVELRYDGAAPAPRTDRLPTSVVTIDRQFADHIYNVEGSLVYHEWRESLLSAVAAGRSAGRRLVVVGATIALLGGGVFAAGVLGFLAQAARGLGAGRMTRTPFGPLVLGVPSGLIGFAVAMVGTVLVIVGIVRHVSTTAKRRRVDDVVPPRP